MAYMKTPFNFISLSENVYFPDWADSISHDIPFKDGVSGTIDLEIIAKSPIYIRNGHTKMDAESNNDEYNSFSHIRLPNGTRQYFIPGSSIKGEIRNLIEIMSYGKITVDRKAMFARRDLNNKANYPLLEKKNKIRCGWLVENYDGTYVIQDCGIPMRISHAEIDAYLGTPTMANNFSNRYSKKLSEEEKSASFKYNLLRGNELHGLQFSVVEISKQNDKRVKYNPDGNITGTIVLTGQPSQWKSDTNGKIAPGNKGKYYEFVFEDVENPAEHIVSKEMFDHFSFIYNKSREWKMIKNNMNNDGQPIFFRLSDDNKSVIDFGMAYLYKMPYSQSVYDSLPDNHKSPNPDLAECLFGYIKDNNGKNALKGRIQFQNAYAVGEVHEDAPFKTILGSPKASYYPEYIRQTGSNGRINGNYTTWDNGSPSGWKRYYLRDNTWGKIEGEDASNTLTIMHPLKKECRFKGKISFHNLKPVELGALLAALTCNGQESNYHQLGMGKPYGFGKCEYNISLNAQPLFHDENATTGNSIEYYIAHFNYAIENFLKVNDWYGLPEMKELLSISTKAVSDTEKYKYMKLSVTGDNEFNKAKSEREYLQPINIVGNINNSKIQQLSSEIRQRATIEEFENEVDKLSRRINRLTSLESTDEYESLHKELNDKLFDEVHHDIWNNLLVQLDNKWEEIINAWAEDFRNKIQALRSADQKDKYESLDADVSRKYQTNSGQHGLWTQLKQELASKWDSVSKADQRIEDFIPSATSYKQLENKIKQWIDMHGQITQKDLIYLKAKIEEAKEKNRREKKWKNGSYKNSCIAILGEDIAQELFNDN